MAVREEEDEDSGAADERAVVPLRWWGFVGAETGECILCVDLVLVLR